MHLADVMYDLKSLCYTFDMTIFVGADHRGFELKNKLVEYLQNQNVRVDDLGAYQFDPLDDYPDFSQKVAQAILQNPTEHLGVVICGSGVGVSIAANRFNGIRCGLAFDVDQVKHARQNDHINCLAIPSDYADLEKAKQYIEAFIFTAPKNEKKYIARLEKLDK